MKSTIAIILAMCLLSVVSAFTALEARSTSHVKTGRITWFDGSQLTGAACPGDLLNKNYNAHDSDKIGAVTFAAWGGIKNVCFRCAKITNKKDHKKTVTVKIIDGCAKCDHSSSHIDVTKSAFQKIAPLSVGELEVYMQLVDCPKKGQWPVWGKH